MFNEATRRDFLKTTAGVAGLGLPAFYFSESAAAATKLLAPNDTPGIALIGCGGRGTGVAREAAKFGKVVAICDVDEANLEKAKKTWPDAATFGDFRKLLEDKNVNVVVNGTPDHWHTLVNVHAVKAGKDVYSEKPLTLTIDEGKQLVKAVRNSKQILQTGSQQRSDRNFRHACELVRNDRLGKLKHVDVWLPSGRREGPFKSVPVPAGLNWDMWQGQTPQTDYFPERCHLTFRYWWDYSGGTMTDWGAHHLDIGQWGTGFERSGPVSIEAKPMVEMIPGGFTAFSEYEVKYAYANGVTLTCRSTAANAWNGAVVDPKGQQHGVRFEGPDGWIFVSRGKIEASNPELLSTPLPSTAKRLPVSENHMGNFFDCLRTRELPICDVEIGHRSASVCHLGVIALRMGKKLEWNPEKEEFSGDKDANKMLAREMRKPWTLPT